MAGKNPGLFGIYLNLTCLQKSVECLAAIGVRSNDVAVLLPGSAARNNSQVRHDFVEATPGFLGSTTRISVPTSGMLIETLINLGMPIYDAERYENRARNGGVLISVRCASSVWMDRVQEILKRTGAEDISLTRDAKSQMRSARLEPAYTPYASALTPDGNGALLLQRSSGAQPLTQGD